MYNRYTPRQDGSFHRNRVPDSGEGSPTRHNAPASPGTAADGAFSPQPPCSKESPSQPLPSSASGFFSGLLPKNMDTGDLLMLLILLLLLCDGSENAPNPLLTIALFFLME